MFQCSGGFGGVAQRFAQARDCVVKAMVEVDERVGRPNLRPKFLESHYITGALQQCRKYLEWLALQAQSDPTFAQLRRANIQFKDVKANPSRAWWGSGHSKDRESGNPITIFGSGGQLREVHEHPCP